MVLLSLDYESALGQEANHASKPATEDLEKNLINPPDSAKPLIY